MARFKKRDNLKKFLERNKVEVKIHYPKPLHLQKPSLEMGYKRGDFKISEIQAKELLTLPVHQFMSKSQLMFMLNKIKKFYK